MSVEPRPQDLITALGAELTPVRRLPPAWLRTLGCLAVLAFIAALLLRHYGAAAMLQRWAPAPDRAWSTAGAAITAICAAWAACVLAIPGRTRAWAWLPVPGALLWIGASGMGCLRSWLAPVTGAVAGPPAVDCLSFVIGLSIPLSLLLIWLLRRACPLQPVLTAILAGLASAAASAGLLAIFHPIDAAATDLLSHSLAVGIVIAANAVMGGRLLAVR